MRWVWGTQGQRPRPRPRGVTLRHCEAAWRGEGGDVRGAGETRWRDRDSGGRAGDDDDGQADDGHAADVGAALHAYAESAARILAMAASGEVLVPRARKRAPVKPVPGSRSRRLPAAVGADDLLPDDVWAEVRTLIPAPIPGPYGMRSRTGRPVDSSQDRAVIATLAADELLGIPWAGIPVDVSSQLCKARLKAWQQSQVNGQSAWDHIAEGASAGGLSLPVGVCLTSSSSRNPPTVLGSARLVGRSLQSRQVAQRTSYRHGARNTPACSSQ